MKWCEHLNCQRHMISVNKASLLRNCFEMFLDICKPVNYSFCVFNFILDLDQLMTFKGRKAG